LEKIIKKYDINKLVIKHKGYSIKLHILVRRLKRLQQIGVLQKDTILEYTSKLRERKYRLNLESKRRKTDFNWRKSNNKG
jgi:hypothetical protein